MAHHFDVSRKSGTFLLDCLAVLAGAMIATPFLLIVASPFFGGL